MADQLSRFAYPGQDPTKPVVDGGHYTVYDTRLGIGVPGGPIETRISPDGLTIINRTLPGHILFDGQILRRAHRAHNGAWFVTTHGIGNNENAAVAFANITQGSQIFRVLDHHLRLNIDRHHGTRK
jgi:hypothetical protein